MAYATRPSRVDPDDRVRVLVREPDDRPLGGHVAAVEVGEPEIRDPDRPDRVCPVIGNELQGLLRCLGCREACHRPFGQPAADRDTERLQDPGARPVGVDEVPVVIDAQDRVGVVVGEPIDRADLRAAQKGTAFMRKITGAGDTGRHRRILGAEAEGVEANAMYSFSAGEDPCPGAHRPCGPAGPGGPVAPAARWPGRPRWPVSRGRRGRRDRAPFATCRRACRPWPCSPGRRAPGPGCADQRRSGRGCRSPDRCPRRGRPA